MAQLTSSQIFPKKEKKLNQVAVYLNGLWAFAALNNPTKVVNNLSIYKINYDFGLIYEGTVSPNSPPVRGSKGDYVFVDSQGNMKVVTSSMYKMMYPDKNLTQPVKVVSSRMLSDPKFIDKVIENSKKDEYNKPTTTMRRASDRPVAPPCNCDKPVNKPCNCN